MINQICSSSHQIAIFETCQLPVLFWAMWEIEPEDEGENFVCGFVIDQSGELTPAEFIDGFIKYQNSGVTPFTH